ncbi:phosphoribosylaminoimidazole carboxylase, catalytic subunit [Heliomicrobium modesticaldum Ice1]|uniref:N5-carboxyaminoimidazole ribonucleotide mutase n=1 Tax=Heliobacterium modesticaldum (strain ATCC 51547 / Ice1) TaxID=498761 RepID=B0TED3_HELMI|nr:5-(carboxyamino)imidazole ribonucleotide mutase [Heliomicrobium modesticaldum]ABZ85615.1 phosphoribosylaminoimidazole carboxylase, catalytic subunit [Heliomicrobium modesticaldum Ice1]
MSQRNDKPLVGIIMGSDSDLKVMKDAAEVLEEFGVKSEMIVASAHRTPDRAARYAQTAEERGIEVLIAGAGMAAHLPGVIAAFTVLPVIGVPLQSGALRGWDSLLSIAQMPPGVPVATVAVDGAKNAGLLAVQILGGKHPHLREKFKAYKEKMVRQVEKKDANLGEPRPVF